MYLGTNNDVIESMNKWSYYMRDAIMHQEQGVNMLSSIAAFFICFFIGSMIFAIVIDLCK
jgi:hypothetical protein